MGRSRTRSRSLSPVRRKRAKERDRSKRKHKNRSKSRERKRRTRSRSNSRERSRVSPRHRRNSRSRSRSRSYERRHRSPTFPTSSKSKIAAPVQLSESDLAGKSVEEIEMMKVMGFCGFDSTKGKKVEGNNAGEVHVILKRKYRQYMNRKGGFNRPLDFVA